MWGCGGRCGLRYFNPNYELLARVVEMVSGEPFAAYLQTHIFRALKTENTFSATTAAGAIERSERLAQGHVVFGQPAWHASWMAFWQAAAA